ncbi:MAG: TetR/AcrR family transcriptional regulator, partial [Actinomycetota bacterium]
MAVTSRSSARRTQLVEVARKVLIEEGLDGFVVRRIAELADVRVGNLQYYFPTRIDLLAAVVRHELEADLGSLEGAASDDDDPTAALRELLFGLIGRWSDGATDVYLPAGLLALHDETMARVIDEVWLTVYDAIADRVRLVDPHLDVDEARARAVLITSLLDGASLQRIDAAGIDRSRFVERTV